MSHQRPEIPDTSARSSVAWPSISRAWCCC